MGYLGLFMKKEKGFTLVELIAVIALALGAFISVKNKLLQKEYDNLIAYIESKAATYAKDTSITTVSVDTLIKKGYLISDDLIDIYDPRNGKSLNCYIIRSKFIDNEYVAALIKDLGETDGVCNSYETTNDFVICRYLNNGTCSIINENKWIKEDIMLGVMNRAGQMINDGYNFFVDYCRWNY